MPGEGYTQPEAPGRIPQTHRAVVAPGDDHCSAYEGA